MGEACKYMTEASNLKTGVDFKKSEDTKSTINLTSRVLKKRDSKTLRPLSIGLRQGLGNIINNITKSNISGTEVQVQVTTTTSDDNVSAVAFEEENNTNMEIVKEKESDIIIKNDIEKNPLVEEIPKLPITNNNNSTSTSDTSFTKIA